MVLVIIYPRSTEEFSGTRLYMNVHSSSNWNLELLVFEEMEKPEFPEENLSQQGENQQ